jgi:hypothetical protein
MLSPASRHAFSIFLVVALALTAAFAQSRPARQKPQQPEPSATPPPEPDEMETLKTETDLVTVPIIATDRSGLYITDLQKEEFKISEDGVPHEVAFFGKVAAPFHVVLMLDTSASTKDHLKQIQNAAFAFVQQLQPVDRVKVISFDDKVRDLNDFTADREILRTAINSARAGEGTKVYDAVELAINSLRKIRGRRAIVLFSDGMDWYSDKATFEGTVRYLDEEGIVVYPIRYDTRATTERLAREQSDHSEPLPTLEVIRKAPPSGTTAPTFPGGEGVPTSGSARKTGPFGLPLPEDIMRRRREEERNKYPDPSRGPAPTGGPDDNPPNPSDRNKTIPRVPDSREPGPTVPTSGPDDSIKGMLDMGYLTADSYLKSLAEKTGGRLLRADTIASLPDAFGQIAAELRTQYMLGYYPLNKERDERYRKIKVQTTRKDVAIRARPGYIATKAQ